MHDGIKLISAQARSVQGINQSDGRVLRSRWHLQYLVRPGGITRIEQVGERATNINTYKTCHYVSFGVLPFNDFCEL